MYTQMKIQMSLCIQQNACGQPACVASSLSTGRLCEHLPGNTNFCEPQGVLFVGNCWRRGGRRRNLDKGGGSNEGSADSERAKRTSANDKTLAKQGAAHFCFALKYADADVYVYMHL